MKEGALVGGKLKEAEEKASDKNESDKIVEGEIKDDKGMETSECSQFFWWREHL